MKMCKNVGPVDRAVRAVLGVAGLVLAFAKFDVLEGGIVGVIAAAFGVIMLLTAAIGMCPLYLPLKISTCATPKS
jgi:hypothetical protein